MRSQIDSVGERLVSSFVQSVSTGVDTFVCWNVRVQRRNIKGNKCSIGWEAKDVDFPKYVEKMGRVLYVGRE